jgi:hypothetical protein
LDQVEERYSICRDECSLFIFRELTSHVIQITCNSCNERCTYFNAARVSHLGTELSHCDVC